MTILLDPSRILPHHLLLTGTAIILFCAIAGGAPARAEPSPFEKACSADMDFAPGSTDYRSCVEVLTRAQTAQREQNAAKADQLQQRRVTREERACTEIGLTPRDAVYSACVSMMQNAAYRPLLPSGE
ncbi:MAG TPA: hypothetical protein VKP60_21760 [Magnetospirillaceae bacterium]|nr:hypothetical protein [Magnetospirillaceae bacterium]